MKKDPTVTKMLKEHDEERSTKDGANMFKKWYRLFSFQQVISYQGKVSQIEEVRNINMETHEFH